MVSAFNSTLWVRLNLQMFLPVGESGTLWLRYLTGRVREIVCRDVLQSLIPRGVMHAFTIPNSLCGNGKHNVTLEERSQKKKLHSYSLFSSCFSKDGGNGIAINQLVLK